MALKPCSNTLKMDPCSWGTRNTFAHNIGVSVSATNPEITTAPATAMPNSLNSRPVEPRRNPSGVNTATSAIVVAITANPISLVPLTAACSGFSLSSPWCRYAFSSTMMASSTTMPIAMVSASRVKLLIEKPRKYMIANVATIDAGIASPGMIVARTLRRNTKMINTTRIAAMSNVRRASLIECVTNTDPSHAVWSFTPGGSACWMLGSASRMLRATSMRFALDCRRPVVAENRAIIFRPQLDLRDVLELYELGALASHGQFAELPRGLELTQRTNRELAPRRFDAARWDFDIARDDRILDVLHGEPTRRQGVGLYPDPHRVAPLPEDAGAADAREALQPCLHEPIGDVGELHQVVVVAAERQPEEWLRVGRLLRDHGLEHIHGETAAHPRHLVAHVLRGQ